MQCNEDVARAALDRNRLLRAINKRSQQQEDLLTAFYEGCVHSHQGEEDRVAATLSGMADKSRTHLLRERLLHRLQYTDMTDRHNRIARAHAETFQWIFDDVAEDIRPWDSFSEWLRTGQGLYWITGKAGSGKSTLMKYLYHHPKTPKLLQASSPNLQLVTPGFFFWNSGAQLQMSQLGLLRTLMFEALQRCPDLAPIIFPERWHTYTLFGGNNRPWTKAELLQAFHFLIHQDGVTIKLCFFVDGLDEFKGDPCDLIRLFHEAVSRSHAKFCVASRPWPVFQDAFQRCPSLMLQDLTLPDIRNYVSAELCQNDRFEGLMRRDSHHGLELVHEISAKAAGVFLWVTLVVRSLLEGLTNADRISDLRKRLEALPPDLEELYEKLLDSLDPFYFEHASQFFQMVRANRTPLTLLEMSFADEEDPKFAFRMECKPLSNEEVTWRHEEMNRRINSRTKGLLEAPLSKPLISSKQGNTSQLKKKSLEDNYEIQQKSLGDVFEPRIPIRRRNASQPENKHLKENNETQQAEIGLAGRSNPAALQVISEPTERRSSEDTSQTSSVEYPILGDARQIRHLVSRSESDGPIHVPVSDEHIEFSLDGAARSSRVRSLSAELGQTSPRSRSTSLESSAVASGLGSTSTTPGDADAEPNSIPHLLSRPPHLPRVSRLTPTAPNVTPLASGSMRTQGQGTSSEARSMHAEPTSRSAACGHVSRIPVRSTTRLTRPSAECSRLNSVPPGISTLISHGILHVEDLPPGADLLNDSFMYCGPLPPHADIPTTVSAGPYSRFNLTEWAQFPHTGTPLSHRSKPSPNVGAELSAPSRSDVKRPSGSFKNEDHGDWKVDVGNETHEPRVEYLHRTVKDFLERNDIWARILAGTGPAFTPNRALCRSFLARLKTAHCIDSTGDSLWLQAQRFISVCVLHAVETETATAQADIPLMEELDRVATIAAATAPNSAQLASSRDSLVRRGAHWTGRMGETNTASTFMAYAVKKNLLQYVRAKAGSKAPPPDRSGRSLLHYVTLSLSTSGLTAEDYRRSIEMAKFLLELGADPNDDNGGGSPWRTLLSSALDASKSLAPTPESEPSFLESQENLDHRNQRMQYWSDMVELFITFGADPVINRISTAANCIREAFSEWDVNRTRKLERMLKQNKQSWALLRKPGKSGTSKKQTGQTEPETNVVHS